MSDQSMTNSAYTTRIPQSVRDLGPVPEPMISTMNPAYERWVERAALRLCDDAGELGEIPTPCSTHLREARQIATQLRITIA